MNADSPAPRTSGAAPAVLEAVAWAGAAANVAILARFVTNGFWGDDWELLAAAFRGAGAFDPIAAHLRPMVRLHFLLAHLTTSATAFHLVSLAMHGIAALAAARLVTRLYDARTGRTAALLFAAAFPASEAVYWVSAIGVVDCMVFSLAALWLWSERRPLAATLCLTAAAFSYELWLTVPALFLVMRLDPGLRAPAVRGKDPDREGAPRVRGGDGREGLSREPAPLAVTGVVVRDDAGETRASHPARARARRGRLGEWAGPVLLVAAFAALTLVRLGPGSAAAYGGPSLAELPARLAVHALRTFVPWSGAHGGPLVTAASIGALAGFGLLAWRKPAFRFPVLFYVFSAGILSLSDAAPSRFHYFPLLGIAIAIALLGRAGRAPGWIGAALALLVLGTGVSFNVRDGRDYRALARLGSPVAAEARRLLAAAAPGDAFVFVNRTGPEPLLRLAGSIEGSEKILFVRPDAVNGVVYLKDLATIGLGERGLRDIASPCRGTQIDIGSGPPVARYCFTVAPR